MAKMLKAGDDGEAVAESATMGLPDPVKLKKHLAEMDTLKGRLSEIQGKMGAAVKTAEDDLNIHRKAAKLVVQLGKMDATKRAEYLTHFDFYRKEMGLDNQSALDLKPAPKSDGAAAQPAAEKPKADAKPKAEAKSKPERPKGISDAATVKEPAEAKTAEKPAPSTVMKEQKDWDAAAPVN